MFVRGLGGGGGPWEYYYYRVVGRHLTSEYSTAARVFVVVQIYRVVFTTRFRDSCVCTDHAKTIYYAVLSCIIVLYRLQRHIFDLLFVCARTFFNN